MACSPEEVSGLLKFDVPEIPRMPSLKDYAFGLDEVMSARTFDPTEVGLPKDFCLTAYSRLKG